MSGDDDAERRRLEAVAYGPGTTPEQAARARAELEGRRRAAVAADVGSPGAVDRDVTDIPVVERQRDRRESPQESAHDTVDDILPVERQRGRRWSRRGVLLGAGAVVAAGAVFAAGIGVGTLRKPSTPTAPSPTDGRVTVAQLLDAPQTFADQLPGAVEAPVVLHSTRLVFTNRSLSGDDQHTPWDVYAGEGTDRSLVCLVASPDGLTATEGCYPRSAVLAGSVTLVAQDTDETLVVRVRSGVLTGEVSKH